LGGEVADAADSEEEGRQSNEEPSDPVTNGVDYCIEVGGGEGGTGEE
jgi:hypothetical protein